MGRPLRRAVGVGAVLVAVSSLYLTAGAKPAASRTATPSIASIASLAAETQVPTPDQFHGAYTVPRADYQAYATGFSDVIKLGGSAILGEPAPSAPDEDVTAYVTYELPNAAADCAASSPECSAIDYAAGQLSYDGKPEFPPVRETFLAYGFEPVTATLTLIQAGSSDCAAPGQPSYLAPMCIYNDVVSSTSPGTLTVATAQMRVAVTSLAIDGTPVDVGRDCQSQEFGLTLTGSSVGTLPAFPNLPSGGQYSLNNGGTLNGTVSVPAFTACATPTGENLAPLLDSSVSGAGNYVQLTQGALCEPSSLYQCPPAVPSAQRAPPEISLGSGSYTVTCSQGGLQADIGGAPGSADVGSIKSFDAASCASPGSAPGADSESCSFAAQNLPWSVTARSYDPAQNLAIGSTSSVDLAGRCTDGSGDACTFEIQGSINVFYDYGSGVFGDIGSPLSTTSSTCKDILPDSNGFTARDNLYFPQYSAAVATVSG